jgi:hypothetical protein
MGRVLRARDDRRAVLQQFVTTLEPEDAELLRALLASDGGQETGRT